MGREGLCLDTMQDTEKVFGESDHNKDCVDDPDDKCPARVLGSKEMPCMEGVPVVCCSLGRVFFMRTVSGGASQGFCDRLVQKT